ncbi:hypothetical protein INR49_013800 [Caranx melampygus]|nr:hypothetical protein INR49_013800 [Caranx melampygus]
MLKCQSPVNPGGLWSIGLTMERCSHSTGTKGSGTMLSNSSKIDQAFYGDPSRTVSRGCEDEESIGHLEDFHAH